MVHTVLCRGSTVLYNFAVTFPLPLSCFKDGRQEKPPFPPFFLVRGVCYRGKKNNLSDFSS